jgi:creatinine amidohydrolase
LSVHRLEELSTTALDALDRERTVVIVTVSPLEQHGPHLPLGVDTFTARYFAEAIAERLVAARPAWTVVLAPTLPVGSFAFQAPGTVTMRQRVVRDLLVDYGTSLARAGFRYILVANGHGGPGHLAALDEASARVSRRHRVVMASFTGHLMWEWVRGRYVPRIEAALGRALTDEERRALADDAHGGWLETSMMLMLRPDLVDDGYRELPPARYGLASRLRPNYPLKDGGQGYVGHPALADPAFAKAASDVLVSDGLAIAEDLLDGRLVPADRRSPFFRFPVFRTNFTRVATAVGLVTAGMIAWVTLTRGDRT